MLNYLWVSFFIIAAIAAVLGFLSGDTEVFANMVASLFDMAATSVDIMIILFGTLTLWMGILKIAEKSGMIEMLAKLLSPLFHRLMPEIPVGHQSIGLITLNFAANLLGLDNAATPIGLKAMKSLQELNPVKDVASNAQILFLVLNSSSLTLLPVTIFFIRAQQGATDPTLVFLPILLATTASSFAGLLIVALVQKIKLWQPVILFWLFILGVIISLIVTIAVGLTTSSFYIATHLVSLLHLQGMPLRTFSSVFGNVVIFALIIMILLGGTLKKVAVYDAFIEGAKEAFDVAKSLLPYMVAMLCAIGVLRASGALDYLLSFIKMFFAYLNMDTSFVDALPTALVKPFSGSGARAMMIDSMQHFGVDSFPALVSATMQGSTETTFYVLAVYFGSVGIKKVRHAVGCALFADLAGAIASIVVCYWFFK